MRSTLPKMRHDPGKNIVYHGYQAETMSIMDIRHEILCEPWIIVISIAYHGYQKQILHIIDARYRNCASLMPNTNNVCHK